MSRRRDPRPLAAFLLCAALVAPREVRADGDEAHSELLREEGVGLRLAVAAIGLAGRAGSPVTSADLVLDALPAGATVERVYLYWVVYALAGDDTVNLAGTEITGALIGTSADTCWIGFTEAGTRNFVYRAEVTAIVTGNGTYTLTGFPSGSAPTDSQGASLLVLYRDPADPAPGVVVVNDGAITAELDSVLGTFEDLSVPAAVQNATFRHGVGDGQSAGAGSVNFMGSVLPRNQNRHFTSADGPFWDATEYDVTASLQTPGTRDVTWSRSGGGDCLVFAYVALSLVSAALPGDAGVGDGDVGHEDGGPDAGQGGEDVGPDGGQDVGERDLGGPDGGSATPDAGVRDVGGALPDAGVRDVGGADGAEEGCGCAVSSRPSPAGPDLVALALLAGIWARRRSRARRV